MWGFKRILLFINTNAKEKRNFVFNKRVKIFKMDSTTEKAVPAEASLKEEKENPETFEKIVSALKAKGVEYKLLIHEPTRTSEESAKVRGATLASGAKAMLVKEGKDNFLLCVMAADRKVSWKKVKTVLSTKKINLASEEEVKRLTKCIPGAVPPFGSAFELKTYLDKSLIDQGDTINFNCGLRTHSLSMATKDYLDFEKPLVTDIVE